MIIDNPDDIDIGHWWTICCHEDLKQIETEADLGEVREMKQAQLDDDSSGPHPTIYETEREALIDIRKGWSDPGVLRVIDDRLRELEAE